jgi:hypothetical protein
MSSELLSNETPGAPALTSFPVSKVDGPIIPNAADVATVSAREEKYQRWLARTALEVRAEIGGYK